MMQRVTIGDLESLREYLRDRPTSEYADLMIRLVEIAWWEGIALAVRDFGFNPNRPKLLLAWREYVFERSYSYSEDCANVYERDLRWGFRNLINLGCNPFLCDEVVLEDSAYSYYMKCVSGHCKRAVMAYLGCKTTLSRDTRQVVAQAIWATRRDWTIWGHPKFFLDAVFDQLGGLQI